MTPDPRSAERAAEVLDQHFDAGSLYQLRAAVAAHTADLSLPLYRANDIVIAVHELATNTVRHGPGHGRLRLWKSQQALVCEVADDGAVRSAGVAPEPALASHSADDLPWPVQHGHGLWLVRKVADNLAVRRDGNGVVATVRFTFGPPAGNP